MFQRMKLNAAIKKSKKKILAIEKRRSRSQAALVEAILTHTTPDDKDVEYFNMFTGQIEAERAKMHATMQELDELTKKQYSK